jgi:predicted transcriptional regulator YheO
MENSHRKIAKPVTRLGIKTIADARYTETGNVVVYMRSKPDKSTRISVTNALRGKARKVTWKSTRGSVFGITELK